MRYTVKVTSSMITNGYHTTNDCPIAIGLKRAGFTYVTVCEAFVKVRSNNRTWFAHTSYKAQDFIERYDARLPVKPDIFRFDFHEAE